MKPFRPTVYVGGIQNAIFRSQQGELTHAIQLLDKKEFPFPVLGIPSLKIVCGDETPASRDDVERALLFARSITKPNSRLMIHCKSGISRSAAMAMVVLSDFLSDPKAGVAEVLQIEPAAIPNFEILTHGDAILGYNGALLHAADKLVGTVK